MRHCGAGETRGDIRRGVAASDRDASTSGTRLLSVPEASVDLDDEYFEELKEGLLYTHSERIKDDGQGFFWTGLPPAPGLYGRHETESEIRQRNSATTW